MKPSSFVVDYDYSADVLYVNDGNPRPAETREYGDGFLWRYDRATHALIGVTIEFFSRYRDQDPRRLADRLHEEMHLADDDLLMMAKEMISAIDEDDDEE